jgi:hypothetical protein
MLKNIEININNFDIYILNDQPTTCSVCNAKTDFEDFTDNVQLHECVNPDCGYQFITEIDDEFL